MQFNRAKFTDILLKIVMILNISFGLVFLFSVILAVQRDLLLGSDFSVFYSEGLMIREGHPSQIYDVNLEKSYQLRVLEGRSYIGDILPFVYPPHVALLFVPFSFFPRQVAFLLWLLCQVLVLFYFFRLLKRLTPEWNSREHWLMGSSIVAYLPLLFTFSLGAFSLIILTCLMQFYGSLKNHRDKETGLWFVLGMMKPQWLVMPGVLLLAARRWRTIATVILGGSNILILSSFLLGWHIWPDYIRLASTLTGYFGSFGFVPEAMYNFRGILTLLLGNNQANLINRLSLVGLAASSAAIVWIWNGKFQPEKPEFKLRMGLTLLLGLLFNLHVYHQDGLQLIGPAVLFYDYLRQRGLLYKRFAVAALSFPYIFLISWLIISSNLFILVPVLSMFVLLIWMGKVFYDEQRLERHFRDHEADDSHERLEAFQSRG